MLSKKINHGRIKPKAYKDKNYLSYMHNSGKTCLVCGSNNIELHHVKTKILTDRDDSRIVPLCPNHHRGKYSPHGFDLKQFYEDYPLDYLLKESKRHYDEYKHD